MQKDALRLLRVFHNLNRKELSERLGLSASYVSELEAGTKRPSLEVLKKYSEGLGISLSEIMLFAERVDDSPLEGARVNLGKKATQILEWLVTITEDSQPSEAGNFNAKHSPSEG